MSSSADARGPSYSSLKLAESSAEVETIFGEGAPATRIVCGVFFFADEDHPAVVGFPSCIHVPADAHLAPWLAGLTQAVVAEAMERGPGSDVVMARSRSPEISAIPAVLPPDRSTNWPRLALRRIPNSAQLRC